MAKYNPNGQMGKLGETEAQYDERIEKGLNEVRATRPDVTWVASEHGFYGHSKVETSYTVVGNNQPRTPNHPQDSFYRNVKNPIGRS